MIPAHFICWNHFYSFLSVQTRVQETRRSGPPESRRTLSRRNHFSSFLPGETGAQGDRRSGSPGCTALFFKGTTFPHSLCFTDTVGRTRLSPAVLPLALRCKEIAKFWQYGKRPRRCSDSFRQHPDTVLAKVA